MDRHGSHLGGKSSRLTVTTSCRFIIHSMSPNGAEWTTDRPTVMIARTVKGKGLSFLERDANSHNVSFGEEDLDWAMQELRYS